MYCPKCGAQIQDGSTECSVCHESTESAQGTAAGSDNSQQHYQPAYQTPPAYSQAYPGQPGFENDKSSVGFNILSFFVPLVGLILFLTWKDKTPKKAKGCGIGALVGFIVGVVLSVMIAVVVPLAVLSSYDDYNSQTGEQIYSQQNQLDSSEAEDADDTYAIGTRTDTTWESKWFELKYTLPDNMVMATDDEINNMMEIGADALYKDSATGQQLIDYSKITVVYEMMALRSDSTGNVIVMAEKLALSGMTEQQYITALKQQLDQAQAEIIYQDLKRCEVADSTFYELPYTMMTNGTTIRQSMLVKKEDDRMAVIALTYANDTVRSELLAGFSELN